jgi:hypothetical protein
MRKEQLMSEHDMPPLICERCRSKPDFRYNPGDSKGAWYCTHVLGGVLAIDYEPVLEKPSWALYTNHAWEDVRTFFAQIEEVQQQIEQKISAMKKH